LFLEVQRNRTIPFWAHSFLVPLDSESCQPLATAAMPVPESEVNDGETRTEDEESVGADEDLVNTSCQQLDTRTFQESMLTHIKNIRL